MLLTVLGIVATIIFGLLGILYVLKYRDRVSLSYMEEDCIPLFESIVKNMEGIDIRYENQRISPSVALLKGCFINTGNKDIDQSIIHEPVSLLLPEKNKWLKAMVVSTSPRVGAKINTKANVLELSWDLLKKNEFIRFDALIQAEEAIVDRVGSKIAFTQRITNLDKVERQIWPLALSRYILRDTVLIPIVIIVATLASIGNVILFPPREIHFLIEEQPGNTVEVSVSSRNSNAVLIRGVENPFRREMNIDTFAKQYKPQPVVGQPNMKNFLVVAAGVLLLMVTVVSCSMLRLLRQRKIMRSLEAG